MKRRLHYRGLTMKDLKDAIDQLFKKEKEIEKELYNEQRKHKHNDKPV